MGPMPAGHFWLVEILGDLGRYADENGLPALAHELRRAGCIARAELALQEACPDLVPALRPAAVSADLPAAMPRLVASR